MQVDATVAFYRVFWLFACISLTPGSLLNFSLRRRPQSELRDELNLAEN